MYVWGGGYAQAMVHVWRSEYSFSPSTMQDLGIQLRSSGMAAGKLICSVISSAQDEDLNICFSSQVMGKKEV